MAKILMVQLQNAPYVGTAYLNGAAKSAGHEFVLHLGRDKDAICNAVKTEQPDIVGFSCMTGIHTEALEICERIKSESSVPTVMGGPHPTLFPEVIEHPALDVICRGEGELTLIEMLNALKDGRSLAGIPSLWVKQNGEIVKSPMRPLVNPLDDLPPIDWSCYQDTVVRRSSPVAFPVRGCPFSCSYCFNASIRDLYGVTAKDYVRHLSVERTLQEIDAAIRVFEPNPVLFTSDTFGCDLPWMEQLLARYSEMFELPFVLLLRPEFVSERLVQLLAEHKCHSVAIGVESGSERVRREILNRRHSNELLIKIAGQLHAAGIKFRTYNMIGLPGETEDEMWETVDINVRMKADYPRCAIFSPMPGTKLTQKAIAEGYLDADFGYDDIPFSILSSTVLHKVDHNQVKNLLHFFQTAVLFPGLRRVLRRLTHWRPNLFFRAWFYLLYAHLHRKSEGRRMLSYVSFLFANRKQL